MNVEEFQDFCMSLKGTVEKAPWSEDQYKDLITFSIGDKWFALLDPDNRFSNLKCNPERVIELTEKYKGCFPAWHMNKTHWIGVRLESDIPDRVIKGMIADSYNLIATSLNRKKREELGLSN